MKRDKNTTRLACSVAGTAVVTAGIMVVIWLLTKSQSGSEDCVPSKPSPAGEGTTPAPPPTPSPAEDQSSTLPTPTTATPYPMATDQFVRANVSPDSVFHVWFRAVGPGQPGTLYVRKADEPSNAARVAATSTEVNERNWFDFREFEFLHNGELELSWSNGNTIVSYIYVFEPERVSDEGIRILHMASAATRPPANASFHLRPPLGWNNDPAGFSRTPEDGHYHLFYQHNPHAQRWGAMHWGYATSPDLIHWVNQPIALRPMSIAHWDGGMFTGSAFPAKGGGLRIYYTDHDSARHPREFQRSVLMKDMIRPVGPPRDAISNMPPEIVSNFTEDFRDPNILRGPDGNFLMTTASRFADGSGGVVQLWKQNEAVAKGGPAGWEYKGIIHKDMRWGSGTCECTGLIPLGDPTLSNTLWAVIYGLIGSKDEDGRENLSVLIAGTFDGEKFKPKFERLLDFISGTYAYQGFYDPIAGEALLIGWLGNWHESSGDYPCAFTLPRVLKLSAGGDAVVTAPHPSVAQLRDTEVDTSELRNFKMAQLPKSGAVEIYLEVYYWRLSMYGPLRLEMNQAGMGKDGMVTVIVSTDGLEVVLGWKNSAVVHYKEPSAKPTALQIFVDVGSIEVYCDGGRWTGTARIPNEGRLESAQLIGKPDLLNGQSVKMWALKSTQPNQ